MLTYDHARPGATLRAKQLRRDSTEAEKKLWRALRAKLPGFKWRRQMPIGPYFADLACFAERLVVELDGGQHAEASEYDAARSRFIEAEGYRVLRFWNNDVMGNIDGVLEAIAQTLSHWERDGAAELRKGEVIAPPPTDIASPSRSKAAGPSLSHGRGKIAEAAQ